MKKFKGWIKTHWFATVVISISAILTLLSAYYAWDFAKDAKEISDKRAIYQLGVTAIAASVGIGTILNSTRSASIAAESMKLTKDKELREQSSHLVPVSPSGELQLSMPNQREDKRIFDFSDMSLGRHLIIENAKKHVAGRYNYRDRNSGDLTIKLMNVGKGSCINLEYMFGIDNLKRFNTYFFSSLAEEDNANHGLQYTMKTIYNQSDDEINALEIIINEISLQRALEWVGVDELEAKEYSEYCMVIEDLKHAMFKDFMKPQSETSLPIPPGFLILCKQYMIASHTFFNNENGIDKNSLKNAPNISRPIAPIGRITLAYHDESLIRLGELSPDKKTTFEYTVTPKVREHAGGYFEVPFYLEIKPIDPKTKKKRAYR